MIKTEIKTVVVGGAALTSVQNVQVASTQQGEQLEIKLTKRTNGVVRFTTQEGAASSSTSGCELPLDTEIEFRLAEAQKIFLISPETTNAQSVDVIIQPVAMAKEVVKALSGMASTLHVPGYEFGGSQFDCQPKNWKR